MNMNQQIDASPAVLKVKTPKRTYSRKHANFRTPKVTYSMKIVKSTPKNKGVTRTPLSSCRKRGFEGYVEPQPEQNKRPKIKSGKKFA